jgi:hypothetical protein
MLPKQTLPHVHTSTCYKETGLPACVEYRIWELETQIETLKVMVVQTRDALRKIGGLADKADSAIVKKLEE